MIVLLPLLEKIAQQYQLDPSHAHGLNHWGRVLENGLKLAEAEGGDQTVIKLFAIFHDACRTNQSVDPGHGSRGANLAERLLGDLSLISRKQLDLLTLACQDHTAGKTFADITIQICWDSDRLDLARVGILPDPACLCTETAKTPQFITWANRRAVENYSPAFIQDQWIPNFRGATKRA
jgi:uncharacterized protein